MPYNFAANATCSMGSVDTSAVFGLIIVITLGILGILLATNIAFFKKLWNGLGYVKDAIRYLFVGAVTFFSGKGIYYSSKYLFTATASTITLKQVLTLSAWVVGFIILGFIVSGVASRIRRNYKTIKADKEILAGEKDAEAAK